MILNPDGTPFKLTGSLQQFDPGNENPETALFNSWDEEVIRQGGSPIYYYEVMIQPNTVDPLYIEDRGKLWSIHPVELWCFYEPQPNRNEQGLFGIDGPDEMIFEFNYRDVLKRVGHPPKIGSKLFTPHKGEHWEIIQRNDGEYKGWGQLRLQLICKKFQDSATNSGIQAKPSVDFKLNP